MAPENLKFTKTHEWVAVEGDTATIGISDFAVHLLSDLVYADLPAVGKKTTQGQPFGEVESVKAVSDLYAPVSGEVIARNERLTERRGPDGTTIDAELDLLTRDPFGEGWMVKVRVADASELSKLLGHAAYQAHCDAEKH